MRRGEKLSTEMTDMDTKIEMGRENRDGWKQTKTEKEREAHNQHRET